MNRHRILIVGVGFAVTALFVAGILIYRTIRARRLTAAIDAFESPADRTDFAWKELPGDPTDKAVADPTEKAVFKNFALQAVFSPQCARLVEQLGIQFQHDNKTKKFVMEDLPSALAFRSRYRDERGRGREVFVFKERWSARSVKRRGFGTIAISDERGRLLTWRELGEIDYLDSAVLERAGDRIIISVPTNNIGYDSTDRYDLAGDKIRPIRVEPFPNSKKMDALTRIDRRGGRVILNPRLGNSVFFEEPNFTDDDLAALADAWDAIGGVKSLDLSSTRITGKGFIHWKSLSSLKELDLGVTAVDDAGLIHLARFKGLEVLTLLDCPLQGKTLAALRDLPELKTLCLDETSITDEGMVGLSELTHLEDLDLANTAITDAGLIHLSKLANLKSLYLSKTKVVGPGLKALRGLRKLKVLNLEGCPIKEKDLKPLKGLPNLKDIVVKEPLL